ncbi:MAG: hypothetical protein A3K19_07265 [Lentisphaerae bacterium RIFOXYB12_FULL_65_16]|nr:MAG: hypothetical protein A3K18_07135 [Lentisphaerae bacterium RIFOXYA12_64_32]OGV93321.1 MAG: hypothetical protein A3K19_07265 [Lentisphaerae bacterium RIFOXYB12_FULL_65_16]
MMRRHVALVALLCSPFLIFSGGCVAFLLAGGAAGGAVAYVRGELQVTLDYSIDACRTATAKAVESLQLTKKSETGDAVCAQFALENAQTTPINIKLERVSDSSTRLVIRVGTFGDQNVSQRVLDEIKSQL